MHDSKNKKEFPLEKKNVECFMGVNNSWLEIMCIMNKQSYNVSLTNNANHRPRLFVGFICGSVCCNIENDNSYRF